MSFIAWKLPVRGAWAGTVTLEQAAYALPEVALVVADSRGDRWRLQFDQALAVRVTARAHAGSLMNRLPYSGALFESVDSAWVRELDVAVPARHFVLCCEREVVEVVAASCRADAAS